MTTTPLLELRDITFSFGATEKPILDGFSMQLFADQKLGLIGPNGCGKTTLFHLLMGLHKATSGTLLFQGKQVIDNRDFKGLRRQVGLLFQDADDQLFSPSVLEDVAFGPLNLGASPKEAKERAHQTLEMLGLSDFTERITHHLSGGEKKLVSLATILVMEPLALLLDEPTNNLDPATREKLIGILMELDQAYMVISHDYDFLADTCRDVYAMDQGKVEQCSKAYLHNHSHAHPHGEQPHRHGK